MPRLPDPESSKPIRLNRNRLAALFGVTHTTLGQWMAEGMPKAARGVYDADACVQWFRSRQDRKQAEKDASGDAKEQLTRAQVERTRLEVSKLRGELVDAAQAQRILNEVAVIVSTQLDGLGPRIAGEVVGMTDVATIQGSIFREARAMRTAIADRVAQFGREVAEDVTEDEAE